MERIKVKIINKSHHPLPAYETFSSAGMDVRAFLTQPVELKPLQRALIPTSFHTDTSARSGPVQASHLNTAYRWLTPQGQSMPIIAER
jgi:hypothetical protein